MKKLFAAALAAVMTLTAPLALAEDAVKVGLIGPLLPRFTETLLPTARRLPWTS